MADEHATHDLDAVASLLDGDLLPADRATAARQVARCPACAALHQELLALSAATAALPTPARTRDFRLTTADAARLAAMPPEPVTSSARPVVDMRTTTDHATHDLERLSAAVDGTLPAADRPSVDAQLAACAACAELHADLLALVAAHRALPTPGRPRDFQLTDADASRLQHGGLRGWLDRIGSPKDRLSRPLAVGLTTLGLVGVLVGTAPSVLPSIGSSAGAAPAPERGCRPGRGGAGAERRGVGRCCRRRDRTAGLVPGTPGPAVRTDPGPGQRRVARSECGAERRPRPGRRPAGARGTVPRRKLVRDADLQPVHGRRPIADPCRVGRRPARRDRALRPPVRSPTPPQLTFGGGFPRTSRHRRDAGHGYTGDPRPRPVRTDPEACRWTA